MIELIDAKIVGELSRIFDFQPGRIIYGQLYTAKLYWVKFLSSRPGIAMLPYMSFYRVPRFHEQLKKANTVDLIDHDGTAKTVRFIHSMFNYTVELMTPKVSDQNNAFRNYMLWTGTESAIKFTDENDINWSFRIIAEDPEDSSDLEAEEDQGRVIRSTFNFQVEGILLEKTSTYMPVLEVLTKIHCYYDSIANADLINTIVVD